MGSDFFGYLPQGVGYCFRRLFLQWPCRLQVFFRWCVFIDLEVFNSLVLWLCRVFVVYPILPPFFRIEFPFAVTLPLDSSALIFPPSTFPRRFTQDDFDSPHPFFKHTLCSGLYSRPGSRFPKLLHCLHFFF